ncbi:flagellar radial spoke component [Strigomonas culicis]|uniref:Flagellar radial spoke component n=1 Tax=Strigomonas culicis TaxID=28005 RepID=S9V701_9TRYP|nr:flagellar radial spoke component [Strigomonas culicis]|eukprot:EPY36859.1 flagellar radial spoke component [Strigomonas culicis]
MLIFSLSSHIVYCFSFFFCMFYFPVLLLVIFCPFFGFLFFLTSYSLAANVVIIAVSHLPVLRERIPLFWFTLSFPLTCITSFHFSSSLLALLSPSSLHFHFGKEYKYKYIHIYCIYIYIHTYIILSSITVKPKGKMTTSEERLEALFQNAKAYLMTTTKDGVSVYDQLTRLMESLLDGDTEEMLKDPTKFNEIMSTLEQHSFSQGESTLTSNEPSRIPPQELQRLNENRTLFDRAPPQVQTVIEQPDPYTTITTTTSKPMSAPKYDTVAQQNALWSAANCGLAESEAFLLDRSITRLAMEKNLQEIRFVGKVFGTKRNYYVLSTQRYVKEGEKVYKEVNTMPKPPRKKCVVAVQAEPGYIGCNRLSFWVTSFPSAEWVLLPDVTPQQINASRAIKRLFTGNLEAEVVSSPPFPWSEAVYLRAQLSRIVSSTFIAPQGALEEAEELEEEDLEDEDEDEEAAKKPKEAKYRPLTVRSKEFGEDAVDVGGLASLDQWVHAEGYDLQQRPPDEDPRLPPKKEEGEGEEEEEEQEPQEDEEEQEEEQEEEEEEEEHELFAPIRGDFLYGVVDIPQPPPQPGRGGGGGGGCRGREAGGAAQGG